MRIGIDVGGTFTDLVAVDDGALRVVKVPSTPPEFQLAVIDAIGRVVSGDSAAEVIHGSTVATNALLQRAGEPIAFVTTEGFRDLLRIGRQNRPELYALHVTRPAPIVASANCFTVRERIDSDGSVIEALTDDEIKRVVKEVLEKKIRHAAVCLLFSFVNPVHEGRLKDAFESAGITCSVSSEILPEFREYERASTTAINASLRPTVQAYLEKLGASLPSRVKSLHIMHSGGGTLSAEDAALSAVRLVLSGPAGGVMGAAFVGRVAGFSEIITYDMGGTSTDVATVIGGEPQWTTQSSIDGLPIGVAMFDIQTVGAGGGSIAMIDTGGALRVGPRSAGAMPGPACYARGGSDATVTDANVVLGRIVPEYFLGGAMQVDPSLARAAVERIALAMKKSVVEAALGIVRVAESNMEHAIRAVTSTRGHDPRDFTLVSFGGAGGLHACALAETLEIPRVLVPPYCGVLSALGMVVAPPVLDVSRSVVHLREMNDAILKREFDAIESQSTATISLDQTAEVHRYADVRFAGQSHELKIEISGARLDEIREKFIARYREQYGHIPTAREIQIVTLRVRRIAKAEKFSLPELSKTGGIQSETKVIAADGREVLAKIVDRVALARKGPMGDPVILIDAEATAYVPAGWSATARADGSVILVRAS